MKIFDHISRRVAIVLGGSFAILLVVWVVIYEPVTRNLVSQDFVCNYCHLSWEYNPDVRLTASRAHPSEPDDPQSQSQCVDCHLPLGWWNATYAYTHFLSITDLFGHFRDRDAERAGAWIPPRAATAYRVRDRMFEYDSNTCRVCHIESEMKPKRKRGIKAHNLALEESKTCIECHNNLVHRQVNVRKNAGETADETAGS